MVRPLRFGSVASIPIVAMCGCSSGDRLVFPRDGGEPTDASADGGDVRTELVVMTDVPETACTGAWVEWRLRSSAASTVWRLSAGALPRELELRPEEGVVTGTVTERGRFGFVVEGAAQGQTASVTVSLLVVRDGDYELLPATYHPTTVQMPLMIQHEVVSCPDDLIPRPVTWRLGIPAPNWVSMSESGLLTGTPTAAGTSLLLIHFEDAVGATGTEMRFLVVED